MSYSEATRTHSAVADSSVAEYTGVAGMPGSPTSTAGKMGRFVRVTGKRQVGLVTANTQQAVGVLENKPQAVGDACTVVFSGIASMVAGGAIAAGDAVTSDATGRVVTLPGTGSPKTLGFAMDAVTAAGHLVPIRLFLGA